MYVIENLKWNCSSNHVAIFILKVNCRLNIVSKEMGFEICTFVAVAHCKGFSK